MTHTEQPFDMVASDLEVSGICLRFHERTGDDEWLSRANECIERAQRSLARRNRNELTVEQFTRAQSLLS
jgi:hypothetical protein